MSVYLINESDMVGIADAIRGKTGKSEKISFDSIASEIASISGGGADLNFEVVGGTEEPSNPTENMIWVNTETEITSWIFSATEPEDPQEGMVWGIISTSSTVEFNALKKNGIQVYPFSAKQYVGGTWVDVTAMSYQGGEWVNWFTYLYFPGNECEDITGGWEHVQNRSSYPAATSMTVTNEGLKITASSNSGRSGATKTKNKIAVTNLSTIIFYVTVTSSFFQLTAFADTTIDNKYTFAAQAEIKDGVTYLDVSELSGDVYVGVYAANTEAEARNSEVLLTKVVAKY